MRIFLLISLIMLALVGAVAMSDSPGDGDGVGHHLPGPTPSDPAPTMPPRPIR